MPSRRDLIRMTPDEVRAYLDGQRRMIVVTNGPGGLPHPVPMNYGIDEQGRVIITSFARSQKVLNLERDPRAALLVESGHDYADLKSVILYADAEMITDAELMRPLMQSIRTGAATNFATGSAPDRQVRDSMAKRVVVRFTPFRTVSWDHAKLTGAY